MTDKTREKLFSHDVNEWVNRIREEAKREVFEDIEIINNEMRKSNDLWRIERYLIIEEVLKRLKQKYIGKK